MNQQSVRFVCTALAGTGKAGRLPKDADGYYTLPVGGLNVFNSMGEFYTYEGAKELFTGSGALMRRVRGGTLKGEYGHPKPAGPIRTEDDMEVFARRVMQLDEQNISHHFAEIWLDFDNVRDERGQKVIAIMAKVTPSGPKGPALAASFENPKEEVCFSIRAFTQDQSIRGVNQRCLREIITWDYVTEPGIAVARKYRSPTLESYQERTFTKEQILASVKEVEGVAMESSRATGLSLIRACGWDIDPSKKPSYLDW